MKLTVGQALTLDQLAYVADLEAAKASRDRAGRIPQEALVDELVDARRYAERMRTSRNEAKRVARRLREENTRLRNLLRPTSAPEEIPALG